MAEKTRINVSLVMIVLVVAVWYKTLTKCTTWSPRVNRGIKKKKER